MGGVSALGAALTQIGVPADQVVKYGTGLKADRYVLMVHGSAGEVARARSILASSKALKAALGNPTMGLASPDRNAHPRASHYPKGDRQRAGLRGACRESGSGGLRS